MRPHFRFEDLEIWQIAKRLAIKLHHLAHQLEERHFYRYAEQLRAAGLSLTNNIAEGSGSVHTQEFKQFLNVSRRSAFEDASMLMVFEALELFNANEIDDAPIATFLVARLRHSPEHWLRLLRFTLSS
jgi:four helix bundle protein